MIKVQKLTISKGIKCPKCNRRNLYPVIYTNNVSFKDIVNGEPFICESCLTEFRVIKNNGTIKFSENIGVNI